MDALLMVMGGVLVPLGFYLLAEYPDMRDIATAATLVGLAAWLSAYCILRRSEKKEKAEKQRDRLEYTTLLTDIREELKRLNEVRRIES